MTRGGLNLGELTLPPDVVTSTQAILAKRGAGKTYTAAVLAEELLEARHQVVVIDPTGAWWGLRAAADGKGEGYPIAVLGGDHGDVPLEEHAGETVADAIVAEHFSAVIDLSPFRKGQMHRFMAAFLETLYRKNRMPLHLVVDEADTIAPQRVQADEARTLGAIDDVVRRGRIRGLGCTLITQRPAVLAKNVLTQCEILTTLRLVHPRDIAAIKEWIDVHAEAEAADEMMASLPSLPIGTAWVWSPGMEIHKRIQVRRRRTFDSSATPKVGQRVKAPKVLAEVDVKKLGAAIAATVERAKENDPRALKVELARLRARVAELEAAPAKTVSVDVPVIDDRHVDRLQSIASEIDATIAHFSAEAKVLREAVAPAMAARSRPVPTRPAARPAISSSSRSTASSGRAPTDAATGLVGNSGLRRILIALAQRPDGLSARQIGVRAGLSSKSGTFSTYLSKARSSGWVEGGADHLVITVAGQYALGTFEPLPTGHELLEHWLRELGTSGAARILEALAEAYPNSLSMADVADRAGLSAGSGTMSTYLSKLRTLELIEGRGELRMSEELA